MHSNLLYNTNLIELRNYWPTGAVLNLLVAFLKQAATLYAGANVKVSLSTHHRIKAAVTAAAMESITLILIRRIRQLLC